jgi:hypothetical protein
MAKTWRKFMAEKVSRRSQIKTLDVGELLERNQWNPFERVDPKILEDIHRRNEKNKITHILETTEDALW